MKFLVLFTLFFAVFQAIAADKEESCTKTPKPDVAADLRISEQKCREYNWVKENLRKCSPADDTINSEYPYMGALGFRKIKDDDDKDDEDKELHFLCGSFLVSPKFSVSAGHCVKMSRAMPYRGPEILRLGNPDIKTANVPRVDAKILRYIVHPQYTPPKKRFDISINELEKEVELTRSIMPVCLWAQDTIQEIGSERVPNYSMEYPAGGEATSLGVTKVEVVDTNACLATMTNYYTRHWNKLEEHQLCANESFAGRRICYGAAGSPIISDISLGGTSDDKIPYALGVNSFGFGCRGGIGIYTRVSSFVDWIEKTVWPSGQ